MKAALRASKEEMMAVMEASQERIEVLMDVSVVEKGLKS
jgi:hypothetical protein